MDTNTFQGFDASMFTLFYPEPPDGDNGVDMTNLRESKVKRVMLLFGAARNLQWLDRYRGFELVLRLQDEDLRNPYECQEVLRRAVTHGARIVAVIVGNEIDANYDLRWRLPNGDPADWGNVGKPGEPSSLARRVDEVVVAADNLEDVAAWAGITLVSPAYIMRGYTEDDAPDPGLHTWRELSAWAYYGYNSAIKGNAVHFYDDGWRVPDPPGEDEHNPWTPAGWQDYAHRLAAARVATATNIQRWMQAVRFWSGYHHHLTWWDEVSCHGANLSANERMWTVTSKAEMLITHRNPEGYVLGERVAMFCPFVSNGTGKNYPAQYIMRDKDAYTTVRRFMEAYGEH